MAVGRGTAGGVVEPDDPRMTGAFPILVALSLVVVAGEIVAVLGAKRWAFRSSLVLLRQSYPSFPRFKGALAGWRRTRHAFYCPVSDSECFVIEDPVWLRSGSASGVPLKGHFLATPDGAVLEGRVPLAALIFLAWWYGALLAETRSTGSWLFPLVGLFVLFLVWNSIDSCRRGLRKSVAEILDVEAEQTGQEARQQHGPSTL